MKSVLTETHLHFQWCVHSNKFSEVNTSHNSTWNQYDHKLDLSWLSRDLFINMLEALSHKH